MKYRFSFSSAREKTLVVMAIVCVTLFLANHFVIAPLYSEYKNRLKTLAELETKKISLAVYGEKLPGVKQQLARTENIADSLKKSSAEAETPFRMTGRVDEIITLLQRAAERNSARILEFGVRSGKMESATEKGVNPNIRKNLVNIKLMAGYREIAEFLGELGAKIQGARLTKFSISPDDGGRIANIELAVYSL